MASSKHKALKEIKRLKQRIKSLEEARDLAKQKAEAAGERMAIWEGGLPLGSEWGRLHYLIKDLQEDVRKLESRR